MSLLVARMLSKFKGVLVGTDALGNRYFEEKKPKKGARAKRWVLYHGTPEASAVAAEWHGWLHYTHASPPIKQPRTRYGWEKPHSPNPTGSKAAYLPPGHLSKGAKHAPTFAAYEAWKP